MKRLLFIFFLLLTKNVHAQYIKLDNGVLFSSFHNNKDLPILSSEKYLSYSFMLGADYLEKNWFYLSSQIGYTKVGGKEINSLPQENSNPSESANYIQLNTTFRAYIKSDNLKFFVGIGPYINALIDQKNFSSPLYRTGYRFEDVYIGGKPEIGVTCGIQKFRVGLLGTYMFSVSPTASTEYISLYNNAFSAMATIAYRIR